jgi:hypothetical protein
MPGQWEAQLKKAHACLRFCELPTIQLLTHQFWETIQCNESSVSSPILYGCALLELLDQFRPRFQPRLAPRANG